MNIVKTVSALLNKSTCEGALPPSLPAMIGSSWYPILAALTILLEHAYHDQQVRASTLSTFQIVIASRSNTI